MILAIDVGLKNLSICIMSKVQNEAHSTINIHAWDVFNILSSEDEEFKCDALMKNGKECGKTCKYKYDENGITKYSCKLHFPKNITIKKENTIVPIKIKDIELQVIVKMMIKKVIEIYNNNSNHFKDLDKILIELQPKCNDKMKLLSHIIYGKIIDLLIDSNNVDIKFIRATQKLKIYDGPDIECTLKDGYAKRKFMSIKYTEYFIDKLCNETEKLLWKERFEAVKKKDDMADVFCYCIGHLYDKKTKKKKS
jgi:hypothetical protein